MTSEKEKNGQKGIDFYKKVNLKQWQCNILTRIVSLCGVRLEIADAYRIETGQFFYILKA
jgi:hypothetical protein